MLDKGGAMDESTLLAKLVLVYSDHIPQEKVMSKVSTKYKVDRGFTIQCFA